jgi:hypothetical protein
MPTEPRPAEAVSRTVGRDAHEIQVLKSSAARTEQLDALERLLSLCEVQPIRSGMPVRYYGSGDLLDPYLSAAIEDAQRAGVVVFAIYTPGVGHYGHSYWRTYWGQIYLSRLTDETGGESYHIGFTGPPVSFDPYLDDLGHHLTHQYFLTFNAKPQKKNGWQPVKVTTEVPNAELVSAGKVYVSAATP